MVDIHITQQEANLLLPLLKQVAEGKTNLPSASLGSTPSSSYSSSTTSSVGSSPAFVVQGGTGGDVGGYGTDTDGSECRYSSEELFQRKERNSRSPSAHSYCHVRYWA